MLQYQTSQLWIKGVILLGLLFGTAQMNAFSQDNDSENRTNMSDSKLEVVIIEQFESSPQLNANWVDVNVENQEVTLSGHVDNLMAKHKAKELAQGIKGIVAVENNIEVQPTERTDSKIRSTINEGLSDDQATQGDDINISVNDGVVTLSGTVNSWEEYRIAEQIALETSGVRKINNNIKVQFEENLSESEIVQRIKTSIQNDPLIHKRNIEVEVNDDEVILTGTVVTIAGKERAKKLARTMGVQEVDASGLQVDPTPPTQDVSQDETLDEEIRLQDQVRRAIRNNQRINPENVTFHIDEDNTITLTGFVNSLQGKESIKKDLQNIRGITRIKNLIQVRPEDVPVGREVIESIENKFATNPYLEDYELSVSYSDGTAYISGTVDSAWEKHYARDKALRTPGVRNVINRIIVGTEWIGLTDEELKDDINDEMFWSPFVEHEQINVEVNDGNVTLSGNVDSIGERWAAIENAYEAGAKDVDSRIIVSLREK